jgi:uncharacterized protein (DUF58 family)
MEEINSQRIQEFSHLELIAKQVVEGFITGLHKSPFHGFSVEFAEHRLYNTGESTKHIDWKLFGRTEKLFTKRYEEETNLRCQIIIDNSSSMYYPEVKKPSLDNLNKISFSVYSAASLMYLLKKQRDAVGLSIFSDSVELQTQARSSSVHQKLMFHELEGLLVNIDRPMKKTFASTAIHQIAENISKRSLVIIFSDMMDHAENTEDMFSAMQHLKHNKHEVILFHVVDKKHEIDFQFENRPYLFVDVETGEKVKVHTNEVKDNYIQSMAKYRQELILRCGQYRIDFVEADINEGFRQILLPYLIKRERLH